MNTNRRLRKCFIALAVLCMPGAASAATLSLVQTDPAGGAPVIGLDSPVELALVVSDLGVGGAPSLAAWDVTLQFDTSFLAYESATIGNGSGGSELDIGGLGTAEAVTPGAGSLQLVELSFAIDPLDFAVQPDSFQLATIVFSVNGFGSTEVGFGTTVLGDPLAAEIITDLNPLIVTTAPVPIPAAWLFPSALLALGWLRRVGAADERAQSA